MLRSLVRLRYVILIISLAGIAFLSAYIFISSAQTQHTLAATVASDGAVCQGRSASSAPLKGGPATGAVDLEDFVFANERYIKIVSGGNYKIELLLTPENANEKLYWSVDDPAVASVSEDGVVSALATGETLVRISDYKGHLQRRAKVEVVEVPATILDVPYITQVYDYPNGCESVSTVMDLNYVGIDVTVDEFIEEYLDMSPLPEVRDGELWGYSPWDYFVGDPRDYSGLCCYAPVIAHALEKFVDTDKYEVLELYGVPLEELCREYLFSGTPVILWGTMYMNYPYESGWEWNVIDGDEGEVFRWVSPMHCVLMVGFDDEYYYFNDPVAGYQVAYYKWDVEEAYEGLFEQALVVRRKPLNSNSDN